MTETKQPESWEFDPELDTKEADAEVMIKWLKEGGPRPSIDWNQPQAKEDEWALEHEWESAHDYVRRIAKKALEKYLMPAGATPEQEGVFVSVKIEREEKS